jgi:hypothetical protein
MRFHFAERTSIPIVKTLQTERANRFICLAASIPV